MRRRSEVRQRLSALAGVAGSRERGAVLLVSLILLLLISLVTYDAMETSTMEAKMAAAREGKEVSFQAAESIIDQTKNDSDVLVNAYIADLAGTAWPTQAFSFTSDAGLAGNVEVRYRAEIAALGNDIVIGNPGLRSLHFELRAATGRADDRFDSLHIQGVRRFAPKLP